MVCLGVPIPMTSPDDFRVCTFELNCVMQSKTFYQSMDQSFESKAGAQAFQFSSKAMDDRSLLGPLYIIVSYLVVGVRSLNERIRIRVKA